MSDERTSENEFFSYYTVFYIRSRAVMQIRINAKYANTNTNTNIRTNNANKLVIQ
jgi:hypothetical protein